MKKDLRTGPERAQAAPPTQRSTVSLAEVFGDCVQGEGVTAGTPTVFIRFSQCNLLCGGHNGGMVGKIGPDGEKVSWWCDTEVIWKAGRKWTFEELYDYLSLIGELHNIAAGTTHIIFTGGEPTMPNNTYDFMAFMAYADYTYTVEHERAFKPRVEVETNGSISGDHITALLSKPYLFQINCSAKLANSGMPKSMRVRPEALSQLMQHRNHWWKFVIAEKGDWQRIMDDYAYIWQSDPSELKRIVLMPAGSTTEELNMTSQLTWQMAVDNNVRYSDRLQVRVWEMATGK